MSEIDKLLGKHNKQMAEEYDKGVIELFNRFDLTDISWDEFTNLFYTEQFSLLKSISDRGFSIGTKSSDILVKDNVYSMTMELTLFKDGKEVTGKDGYNWYFKEQD